MQKDIVVGITSDALSDSLTYGLHHTLTNALSDSLAADLTPQTMHSNRNILSSVCVTNKNLAWLSRAAKN